MPIQFSEMMEVPKPEDQHPFLGQLTKAMELGVGFPAKLKQMDVENSLRQMQTQKMQEEAPYWAKSAAADLALKEQKSRYPLLGMPGAAGQIGALQWLQGNPDAVAPVMQNATSQTTQTKELTNNDPNVNWPKLLKDNIQANLENTIISNQLKQAQINGWNWAHLPMDSRKLYAAKGLGMGIEPAKMEKYINQGLSLEQIAEKEGFDPKNIPAAIWPPEPGTRANAQKVQQIGNELSYMSSKAAGIISKFTPTYMGKSPRAIAYMLSDDPDKQKEFGKYLGALGIQTGIASGRITLEGARSGIEMTKLMKEQGMRGVHDIFPHKLSTIAFDEMQKTMDELIQGGAQIRITTGMDPFRNQPEQPQQSQQSPQGQGKIPIWNKEKGEFE